MSDWRDEGAAAREVAERRAREDRRLSERITSLEARLEADQGISREERANFRRTLEGGIGELKVMLREEKHEIRNLFQAHEAQLRVLLHLPEAIADHERRLRELQDSRAEDRGRAILAGKVWAIGASLVVGTALWLLRLLGPHQ